MNIYKLLKRVLAVKSPRIRLLMLLGGRIAGMRTTGVFIDPVMACNLRCRMCYFSDPASRPKATSPMTRSQIDTLAASVFGNAVKMQIGCGAEPTLYKDLEYLIEAGRKAGIPHIEITTNGLLVNEENLLRWIKAGLNGMTLSLHGTTRDTYEYLMDGADFDKFRQLISTLGRVQKKHPEFKLRINYTANNLNKTELSGLWKLFESVRIDVLQVRPIQKLGDTAYNDFTIEDGDKFITDIINPVAGHCREKGITCFLPGRENLDKISEKNDAAAQLLEQTTYCYISPTSCYQEGFDPAAETLSAYHRRTRTNAKLLKTALCKKNGTADVKTTKKLNYN